MREASKAMRRRYIEDKTGQFAWFRLFRGKGIDVGCGPDKLPFEECIGFDKEDGDANRLGEHFPVGTFDYLHASQCLEHMLDPTSALISWLAVVKKGGHLVISVPDWCLYEGMEWPSRFNPDHKSTWSLWLTGSPAPCHIHVPSWLAEFSELADIKLCRLVDTNYDYTKPSSVDQTLEESDGVEAFIEFVLKKTV